MYYANASKNMRLYVMATYLTMKLSRSEIQEGCILLNIIGDWTLKFHLSLIGFWELGGRSNV